MEKLIAIIRTPTELLASISRFKHQFQLSLEKLDGNSLAELNDLYEIVKIPFDQISPKLYAYKERLLSSWKYLADVKTLDLNVLLHTLIVLLETDFFIKEQQHTLSLRPLEIEVKAFKPTAANPRAYKGTKDRPPKQKSVINIDLRPYLCDVQGPTLILQRLKEHLPKALKLLSKYGYDQALLDNIAHSLSEENYQFNSYHLLHLSKNNLNQQKLPELFIQYFLPLLKKADEDLILEYLGIYWQLNLSAKRSPLIAINRLIIWSRELNNSLQWCKIVAQQPLNRRNLFTTLLLNTVAYNMPVDKIDPAIFQRFNKATSKENYHKWLYYLLLSIRAGYHLEYTLSGFELAKEYYPDYTFDMLLECSAFDKEILISLINYLTKADNYYRSLATSCWKACGTIPEFFQIITVIPWSKFSSHIAYKLLHCYLYIIEPDDIDFPEMNTRMPIVKQQVTMVVDLLFTTPIGYQLKFIEYIYNFYYRWNLKTELQTCMPYALKLISRLCQPPFKHNNETKDIIYELIYYSDKNLNERLLQADDLCFTNLEKACHSENVSVLIRRGIEILMKHQSHFTMECFLQVSARLFRSAKFLGSINKPMRQQVINKFNQLPIIAKSANKYSLDKLIKFIDHQLPKNLTNPVPDKLRAHLTGQSILNDPRLVHYTAQFYKHLLIAKLDILDEIAAQVLIGNYPVHKHSPEMTALQYLNIIDGNKRHFQRFMKAYLNGKKDYLTTHPLTLDWLKAHAKFNLDLWLSGITVEVDTAKYGKLTISLEKDPLEALKLGSYVGSCLGLGGGLTYSAAAVVLDINKQVIYARNSKQKVIARQLIAISETEQLVCFSVYPHNINKDIKEIFRNYDKQLAEALAVTFYQEKDDDYDIELIIAQEWWVDYQWDLKIE